ncbi:MAG: hypothetical protein A2275_19175 [Bacteroidetes bacterium RIFOXYA12_FULL_35_11]|nr:MAG: hypothetical protein A2X01_00880 [Bacteroidetes bacterium GWF2_35_48]OFY73223.1 MAG: hypothetical protein A2275_19175 [Bacteroidetes bacterium RIFOXYA12_FULL_35_11]OFY96839.1 MAG: hypothetical protein A2309_08975 [Bacteroidetes bacterium RIFOXYB2_FULL_35_7]HBX51230.1 hypothetical protein [Bacteroidales bacterium]
MKTILERYGCLTKVEHLWCLESFGIPNSCILESFDIFPGYYGLVPCESKPKFVYIIADEKYSLEEIMRFTKKVKNSFTHSFDGAYTEITLKGLTCCGVRVTGIEEYAYIRELQEKYKEIGFAIKKKVKKIENDEALIKIRKFFELNVIDNEIFLDNKTPDIGYFTVNNDISWDLFAKNIHLLHNNFQRVSFDAAKCFIYQNAEITDMIRIFSKGLTPELLKELKELYCRLAEM